MKKNKEVVGVLFVAGVFAIAFGWFQLFRFAATPGSQQAAPRSWPRNERRIGDGRTPLLVVFVHPGCSCTHATLVELDQILTTTETAVDVELKVYRSRVLDEHGYGVAFDATPWLHRRVAVEADVDGRTARAFRAATSGEVLLYGADGRLLFQGGITPERAHTGDSAGAERLSAALSTGHPQDGRSNVFGCALFHRSQLG